MGYLPIIIAILVFTIGFGAIVVKGIEWYKKTNGIK